MIYYNRDSEILNFKNQRHVFLDKGDSAEIFLLGDMVFKKYFTETDYRYRLSSEMFDILKTICNKHFVELFDIYSTNLLKLISYKLRVSSFQVDAYTTRYYDDNSVNVLCESVDYLLDNFRELEMLINEFTGSSISIDDVKRSNVIIGTNEIVIIDPDLFYISEEPKDSLAIANKKKLLNLLRSICLADARKLSYHVADVRKFETELVDIEIKKNTDVTYELSKKMQHVKRPIEFVKKI